MKFFFDLFPALSFFVAYFVTGKDISVAIKAAIISTFAVVLYCLIRRHKVGAMLWVSLALITIFGGAALYTGTNTDLGRSIFYWKPTVLYWLFTLTLLSGWWLKKINLIKKMISAQITVPELIWNRLLYAWAGFFAGMGALNLVVIRMVLSKQIEEATWVEFKVFGTLVLTIVFVVVQSLYLSRFIQPEKEEG